MVQPITNQGVSVGLAPCSSNDLRHDAGLGTAVFGSGREPPPSTYPPRAAVSRASRVEQPVSRASHGPGLSLSTSVYDARAAGVEHTQARAVERVGYQPLCNRRTAACGVPPGVQQRVQWRKEYREPQRQVVENLR